MLAVYVPVIDDEACLIEISIVHVHRAGQQDAFVLGQFGGAIVVFVAFVHYKGDCIRASGLAALGVIDREGCTLLC